MFTVWLFQLILYHNIFDGFSFSFSCLFSRLKRKKNSVEEFAGYRMSSHIYNISLETCRRSV